MFNENTRVKIPAILHLCRLGYSYLSLSDAQWDKETNVFTGIFSDRLKKVNPGIEDSEIKRIFEDISLALDNEDLGLAFYQKLSASSGTKLIDFANLDNNSFHVVTELPCKNGDDEFRPDITLLVNGMPLAFIEVKKPNNHDGVLAERDRINVRFRNKKFRKFINISQVLVFSNNMEYDADSIEPIQGAFYSTTSYHDAIFNCFREEEKDELEKTVASADSATESLVLADNNAPWLKHVPEFATNKNPDSPTNRLLTSLFSKERFTMLLQFGIAYVQEEKGLEKHIMRYPQFFATRAIQRKIDGGIKKGIIWHTQGSGKTALSYYNVNFLTDYFQRRNIIPKFYFIVDRIDLLNQAKREFSIRGLSVQTVNSKEELQKQFRMNQALHGVSGKREITVVNIQKFKDDTDILRANDYDINVQRIYFLDEVHRSYKPTGSFLANLYNSDRNAILIGLTGTPLILSDKRSTEIFGGYIHQYYYNSSIADGYTLRLIREAIETKYKMELQQALKEVQILKGDADKGVIYSHPKFVEPMLDYIISDFVKSRINLGDNSIGAMVICDSADQARKLAEIFNQKYTPEHKLKSALILHDVGSKDERKKEIEDFKEGKIDILFVYNMLLTGFDAKRLKKLYVGRVIKDHNLLQALTRVNRPYKKFRFGYVVDFADISVEFEKTNKAYLEELQAELGDEMKHYSNLFISAAEIETELKDIKDKLFHYDLENAEIFSQQISKIEDRKTVLAIKKALESARDLYNVIRLYGHFELLEAADFKKLGELYSEVSRHLELLNLKEKVQNSNDTANLLNTALEKVLFLFKKISEAEMIIADQLKDTLRKTREALNGNFDKKSPEFVQLYDELKRIFSNNNLDEISQDEMRANIDALLKIFDRAIELNRKNDLLKAKYKHDRKYARVHKRIREKGNVAGSESVICDTLTEIKQAADDIVLNNSKLLENEDYFTSMLIPIVIDNFEKHKINLDIETAKFINAAIVAEYLSELHGVAA